MTTPHSPSRTLNSATNWIMVAGFLALLVFCSTMFANVAMRFVLSTGLVWLQDLQHYSFFILVPFSIVAAYANRRHIKLETRDSFSPVSERVACIFAVVASGFLFLVTIQDVSISWVAMEGSREPGGLPGFFIAKTLLSLSFLLFFLIASRNLLQRFTDSRQ